MTKTMANDWAQYNIQVNAIGPGWVKTELTSALRQDEQRNASHRPHTFGPVGRPRKTWPELLYFWHQMHRTISPGKPSL